MIGSNRVDRDGRAGRACWVVLFASVLGLALAVLGATYISEDLQGNPDEFKLHITYPTNDVCLGETLSYEASVTCWDEIPDPEQGVSIEIAYPSNSAYAVGMNFVSTNVTPEASGLVTATFVGGGATASRYIYVIDATLDLPDPIGVNDLVPNCTDPAGYDKSWVGTLQAFGAEDDLHEFDWSVSPEDRYDEATIYGDSRVRVLRLYGDALTVSPTFDPQNPGILRLEGIDFSEDPGDAVVTLTYGPCVVSASTTVVRVQLDRFCYNRANPFPELRIDSVSNLAVGQLATVEYSVLECVLDGEINGLESQFTVEDELGTYVHEISHTNRLANTGETVVRYTVYDDDGEWKVRWASDGPSHPQMPDMPARTEMEIEIKDALADSPEEALDHLASTPDFAGEVDIIGSRPHFYIKDVKIFAKHPSPAYTNEVSPSVGNEEILQTLLDVAEDSAVVLEITGPRVVGVNDRLPTADDPGDDADTDRDSSDADFIRLDLRGVPNCARHGVITWEVLAGNIRLVSHDAGQVGGTISTNFAEGVPQEYQYVYVEGRQASEAIDDATVSVKIELEDGNPLAFQWETLEAEFKLTVSDLRWTGWAEDGETSKTDERTEILVSDLDMRPAVRITGPSTGSAVVLGGPVKVAGTVYSMLDIVRDITVNGESVPQDQIFFLGEPVEGMTEESVAAMTDRPPPYIVTFKHDIDVLAHTSLKVEATGGIGPWPGRAKRLLDFGGTPPLAGSSGVVSASDDIEVPAYDLPSMVDFFDDSPEADGWDFLYKTEVDHHGRATGIVACYETCGAQTNGLFRRLKPVVFLDTYEGANSAIPGPGIDLHYPVASGTSIDDAQYDNGVTIGRRKLFPVELQVADAGGTVPGALEWSHGALLVIGGNSGVLRVLNPDVTDLPEDSVVTLTVKADGSHANPFPGFATPQSWDYPFTDLDEEFQLVPGTITGVAHFEVELKSETYGLLSRDRARVTVIQPPEFKAVSDAFTPRQLETPPYHAAKIDFLPWDIPEGTECDIALKIAGAGSDPAFTRHFHPDAEVEAYRATFNMYELYNLPWTYYSDVVERVGWDGRYGLYEAEGDGLITGALNGRTRWADQPADISGAGIVYKPRFEIRNITGALVYMTPALGRPEVRTIPLQLDPEGLPLMGPAPYFAYFRDQINSRYSSVSITGPSIVPYTDGRPAPAFATYFNNNNWRHTALRYGWSHTYDIRAMPFHVGGVRQLYVLWAGDHFIGPAEDGYLWIHGERAELAETEPDREWTLTLRDGTVYTFGHTGQVQSIVDRNGNTVEVTLENAWGQEFILSVAGASGAGLNLTLGYATAGEHAGPELVTASLADRALSFGYHHTNDVYGVPYPPDERLLHVGGDEYMQTFHYADGRRANPASRVIGGEITNRIVGAASYLYGYNPVENIAQVVSSALINSFSVGGTWKLTSIDGPTATHGDDDIAESHDYADNKLQYISISRTGAGSATYQYQFDSFGRRGARSSPAGDIAMGYDMVGNLTSINYPDYSTVSFEYGVHNQLEQRESQNPARKTTYMLDANGNVLETTEHGGGPVASRSWTYVRNDDGSIDTVTDPKPEVSTYGYDNALGLPSTIVRADVKLLDRTHSLLGRVRTDADAEGNTTEYGYDLWDRIVQTDYPLAGTDPVTRTWRPFNDLADSFDPDGGLTIVYHFDDEGKPTGRSETGNEIAYTFTYDEVDNEGDPRTVTVTSGDTSYELKYDYDYLRRITETRIGGMLTGSQSFDPFGNIVSATDGASNTVSYTYYSDSALKKLTRSTGLGSETFTRDGVGNVEVHTTDPGGLGYMPVATVTTEYDAFNRAVEVNDARGYDWEMEYDVLDNLIKLTDPRGHVTEYEYDSRKYRELIKLPGAGNPEIIEDRDDNGNLVSMTDPRGNIWTTDFDELQRAWKVSPPAGGALTARRNLGGAVTQAGIGPRLTNVAWDGWDRAVEAQSPAGSRKLSYDPVGWTGGEDRTEVTFGAERGDDGRATEMSRAGVAYAVTEDGNYNLTSRKLDSSVDSYTHIDRESNISHDGLRLPATVETASGATATIKRNGLGLVESATWPGSSSLTIHYDGGGLPLTVAVDGETTTYGYDGMGNATNITVSGDRLILQQFCPRNAMIDRITVLASGQTRVELFERDLNLNIIEHTIQGRTTEFGYDDANRLESITAPGGLTRYFPRAFDGQIASDKVGANSQTTTYGYHDMGWITSITVQGGSFHNLTYDNEGRPLTAGGYTYTYSNDRKHLTSITDAHGGPGDSPSIAFTPDAAGYAWDRTYPEQVSLTQEVNDIGAVTSSTFDYDTGSATVGLTLADHLRPVSVTRPGAVTNSTIEYTARKEIESIVHGSSAAGATLTRDSGTGFVTARTLHHVGESDSFTVNKEGWILSETRDGVTAQYTYRKDGARTSYSRGNRTADYIVSAGGALEQIQNAFVGPKLRAPYESAAIRRVGPLPGHFPTVHAALTNLVATAGTNAFAITQLIIVDYNTYTNDVIVGADVADLRPTASAPLIIRGGIDRRVTLTGKVELTHVDHVRLQGFHIAHTNNPAVFIADVEGPVLTSCVVLGPVSATNSTGLRVTGNTFDGAGATGRLTLSSSTNTLLRNNIYLNDGSDAGVTWDTAPDSDYNSYWPNNGNLPQESNSIYVNPLLTGDGLYEIAYYDSPVRGAGEHADYYFADVRGWYRHLTAPSIGAAEYGLEQMERDSGGRITKRWVAGRLYEYEYDARGQLVSYTDDLHPQRSATYEYDVYGNRVLMTVGSETQKVTTRFVYQGRDVVAEYETASGSSSTIARRRIYWLLPGTDQRIGFVEIDNNDNRTLYYYLTDQVGSVQQIVRADGTVVNQYDYDAFGNIRWENSFEGVPNRYTFQGREWDAHAMHYHYRFRTYIPEWGCFTGPDMNLSLGITGESNGIGNYLFCNNNPLVWVDPLGLEARLILMDGFHFTLAVLDQQQSLWHTYDFTQTGGLTLEIRHLGRLQRGIDGTVLLNHLTDAELKRTIEQSTAAWRLRTTREENMAMIAEMLRQKQPGSTPPYKAQVFPWGPKDDDGVCVQRALQIINKHTEFDLPLMWLETVMSVRGFNDEPATVAPMIRNLDNVGRELRRGGRPLPKVNDQPLYIMYRIHTHDKVLSQYTPESVEREMVKYEFFMDGLMMGKQLPDLESEWAIRKDKVR